MTELDFYKWVIEYEPEYRWSHNGASNHEDVIIWVPFYNLKSLVQVISSSSLFEEGGIEVRFQESCIAIWASDICDYFGVDLEKIFRKD